jgi:protease-4
LKSTLPLLLCVIFAQAGCLGTIKTDSQVALNYPVTGRLTAEVLLPSRNTCPLVPMRVEAGDGPKIVIIDVDGLLVNQNAIGPYSDGDNPVDLFRERLDAIVADGNVCGVVLRLNSPGGSVTATDIMWRELRSFREATHLPVVTCLMDHGCSGAYYLATASDVIVAHPTTITGGIGVVFNSYNLRDLMGAFSIIPQTIKSGPNIDMGTVSNALPDEVRAMLQSVGNDLHQRFREIVVRSRPGVNMDPSTFDGRVFTAQQAKDRKLIDHIGYLDDAIAAAKNMAHQPRAPAFVFHRENDPARTPYATSPNQPLPHLNLPISIPGLERSRLPTFLYLWQPDPTLIRIGGA